VYLVGFVSSSTAANPKALELKWNFLNPDPLVYSIDQEIKTQLDQFDAATNEWKKTPVSAERIDGNLYLNPTGDGKSRCDLILELKESENKSRATPLPPEQFLPQLVARFLLGSDGGIEEYAGGSVQETYLFLRLILGLPTKALHEHEGRIVPLELYTQAQTTDLSLVGSVIHELDGFERIDGIQCARIKCQISLASRLDQQQNEGSVSWKGDATVYWALEPMRLQRSTWNVGKLIETIQPNSRVPTRIVSIFKIECSYVGNQDPLRLMQQMTPITPRTPVPGM